MPIRNGMRSSARAPDVAASRRTSKAPVRRVIVIVSSPLFLFVSRQNGSIRRRRRGLLVVDQAPDAVLERMEARLALEPQRARPLDADRDAVLDAARPAREH